MAVVEKVEAQGGYVAAQQKGWIRREVERSAARWRELVNSGERRIVGQNCYVREEGPEPEIFEISPDVEQIAIERIRELRATRDSARFKRAMSDFEVAAKSFANRKVSELGDDNLMLAAIEAARADATTGEMMGVLKSALTWGPPY
ncbi:MAG: hypothetical protein H0W28_09280 [Pyrinomonadaceae bacterium]|nr:hypothetical protein [Pyrinomonadaceae bacterium]